MPEQTEQPMSSSWIQELNKQIGRRKHVILYGNIHDQLLYNGSYQGIHDFLLKAYFWDKGFDLIVQYDPVEKYKFARRKMRHDFDDFALSRGWIETEQDLEEVFCNLLGVLSQKTTSAAAIIDLGDMLTSDSIRHGVATRNPLILLKKCTLEASMIGQGCLKGYRNTLVILVSELKGLPEWFYQNNPFVGLVKVLLPNKEERCQFIRYYVKKFYQGDRISADLDLLSEEFADLTAGFHTRDLEALRYTSLQEEIPLGVKEVWRLVDFYKFGQRDDPWEKLNRDKLKTASAQLSRAVIGQPYAIEAVTTMLTSARVGLSISGSTGRSGKPKGVFFFVGPTGVGKTELAKALTKLVFGDERAFARFDMSEYTQKDAAEKLIGAAPGFVGYEEGGQLTNRVLEQPYSILLFDEIEKAHPQVLDKFLQILEDGRLTDGKGQTAYFNQTAIIFTSNIGASDLGKNGKNPQYKQVVNHFETEVKRYLTSEIGRPELLSRLGYNIVVFDMLRPEFVKEIGNKFLGQLKNAAQEKYKLTLNFQPSVLNVLSDRMDEDKRLYGGRWIKTLLETMVERPLNKWIFQHYPDLGNLRGRTLEVGLKKDQLEVKNV